MKTPAKHLAFITISSALTLTACGPPVNEDGVVRRSAQEINRAFRDTASAELALSPETATRLGMEETRLGFFFQHRLDDRSQARFERTRLLHLELLGRLDGVPDIPGDSQLARHLEVVQREYRALTQLEAFGYGRYAPGVGRPYAVDQLSGAWVDVPDLLISSQPLASHAHAEAYVERLAELPGAIADERRRLVSDYENGVLPPAFVLRQLEERLRGFAAQPIDAHPLLQTFGNVVGGLEASETRSANEYRAVAARLVIEEIIPAYTKFADTVSRLASEADDTPGVWTLPEGEAYYREILAYYTAPDADPDFLHEEGQTAVDAITAELDKSLAAIGLTSGSVADRLRVIAAAPGQSYEPTVEGRAAALARLEELANEASAILPELLQNPPDAPLVITRMPAFREAAFTGANYVPATANGSSPGLFQINLKDMGDWSDFSLPTLLHHEGIPGHHVESAAAARMGLPLLRQMIWNTAYGEGWAVYAEDLASTNGLYDQDPLGRIGYLQSVLFRAARLVVDTGIHDRRWSRERAVDYLTETTGLPRSAMEREVARYTVWPGQAAAYYYGRQRLLEIRERAEAVLTGRFDATAFNSAVLTGGPRPLSMVEADVEDWYADLLER